MTMALAVAMVDDIPNVLVLKQALAQLAPRDVLGWMLFKSRQMILESRIPLDSRHGDDGSSSSG